MSQQLADHYLSAFRMRAACCRAVQELSERQPACIAAGNYEELIELLNHKQLLVDQLIGNDGTSQSLWRAWQADRDQLAQTERTACEAVLDETESLLRQILEQDAASTHDMQSQRDTTQAALSEINHAGQAARGYESPYEMSVSRRLDLDL